MILILAVSIAGCTPTKTTDNVTPSPTISASPSPNLSTTVSAVLPLTFTLAELAKFDGLSGRKAYVAVDGIVYDVTNIPQWAMGKHFGYKAGNDLSKGILTSPHGKGILSKAVIVGTLK